MTENEANALVDREREILIEIITTNPETYQNSISILTLIRSRFNLRLTDIRHWEKSDG